MPPMSATRSDRRVAVYSGTFDPITAGHADVIRRAADLFDDVLVAVAAAHHKTTLFSLDERIDMVERTVGRHARIRVMAFDGLIMDFCRTQGAQVVVRGVRNLTDFDYESQMAAMNRKLLPTVDTVFLLPDPTLQCISSTLVREIAKLGGDVSTMVDPVVAGCLASRYPPRSDAKKD